MTDYPHRAKFVVDWDGTCVHEEWPGMGEWLPGAVEGLRKLSSAGKTVIYSMRCHLYEVDDFTRRNPDDVVFEMTRVRAKLDEAGLHAVEIYPPDRGKPPGEFYIDDRAVRYSQEAGWPAVLDMVGLAVCSSCLDSGTVCENHPDHPWDGECCGGAGMPCRACCSPVPEDGRHSITEAFVPDWMRA